MEMKPYMTLFVESCHQPWSEIRQHSKNLLNDLMPGKKFILPMMMATDLTFDIEGFSFINEAGEYTCLVLNFFSSKKGKC